VQADATDPSAVSSAVQVINEIARSAFDRDLAGALEKLSATPGPVELRIHLEYNPDRITQYNIVPGLMGVVLTMTMVMITALAVTRERERGTMEVGPSDRPNAPLNPLSPCAPGYSFER
jgi:ABC-2 type transport system permease protein